MRDHKEAPSQQHRGSWVRIGDLAVLWELQAFLRNLYFITVILLCGIAGG